MRISESCAKCLYDRQAAKVDSEEYIQRVKELLDNRKETDTSPYMIYLFSKIYEELFGKANSYADIKKTYNDFVLNLEDDIRRKIEESDDPIIEALKYSRVGNYIDFGAMNNVSEDVFLSLLENAAFNDEDIKTYRSFTEQCTQAKSFLLICDNCGEIVLDKLFIEQLSKKFPQLKVTVLVRGGEVLNDATVDDADYVGISNIADVIDNGHSIAGTIYDMLPEDTKRVVDSSDVILAKGQGNYESMSGCGMHVFYSFLCKCDLFISRFNVQQYTGMFIEELI